jgi:hypothetical protein
MSNWIQFPGPHRMQPDPRLHVEERFAAEDLSALARLYRRAGAPRPPDEAGIRHLLSESDLALALRAENPSGSISIVAFARALTDFCRDAVILDVLAEPDAPWPAAKLRAEIVSAIVSHPLLREVSRIEVAPVAIASPRRSRPSLAAIAARGSSEGGDSPRSEL